jgi:RNA polymerase sigma factor (sigma-70 family)
VKPDQHEQDLLKGLAIGDKQTIELIYRDHYNLIQSLIINNNGSADDAKDIFQEAMIVLYEKVRSGRFELNCQLKTYLYSVSKRLWLKKLSANNRFVISGADLEPSFPVEEEVEAHEKRDAEFDMMEKAIASLGEPCKSLLEAYYLNKQNMQVIAATFGYTNADNAKNQKYKCLVRLKKIFFAHYKNGMEHE